MSVTKTVSLTRFAAVQPRGRERRGEIIEHLRRLRSKVALADDLAGAVDRGLAGDEDEAAGADFDHLRVARRRAQFGRVDAFGRGGAFIAHGGFPVCRISRAA
jgi:hypothetical protein